MIANAPAEESAQNFRIICNVIRATILMTAKSFCDWLCFRVRVLVDCVEIGGSFDDTSSLSIKSAVSTSELLFTAILMV